MRVGEPGGSNEPTTRPSLLARLRDPADAAAWSRFVDLYAPLVYRFARRRGLQDADAADLTQEVLRAVAGAAGRFTYDPRQGRFRGWLQTVVRNKLINFAAKARRQMRGSGDSAVQELLAASAEAPELEEAWRDEYHRHLFHWAAEQVRNEVQRSTWEAFQRSAVEGKRGQAVATELGMSVAAVYLAKSRVLARIKELLKDELEETPDP